ncbi:hypothetical protein Pelo_12240 [Pelomyxa schiedti]|nr:hypothetical protein Pelo_12240 [Pelomyxa schiedti]
MQMEVLKHLTQAHEKYKLWQLEIHRSNYQDIANGTEKFTRLLSRLTTLVPNSEEWLLVHKQLFHILRIFLSAPLMAVGSVPPLTCPVLFPAAIPYHHISCEQIQKLNPIEIPLQIPLVFYGWISTDEDEIVLEMGRLLGIPQAYVRATIEGETVSMDIGDPIPDAEKVIERDASPDYLCRIEKMARDGCFSKFGVRVIYLGNFNGVNLSRNPTWDREYGPGIRLYWTDWEGPLVDKRYAGGHAYYCPRGWKRFSLNIDEFDTRFIGWHVAYHSISLPISALILETGFRPVDAFYDPTCNFISVSPSVVYAAHPSKSKPLALPTGGYVQALLMCRVNPAYLHAIVPDTFGAKMRIDPNYENSELEWQIYPLPGIDSFTILSESIVCYGIMTRVWQTHADVTDSGWWKFTTPHWDYYLLNCPQITSVAQVPTSGGVCQISGREFADVRSVRIAGVDCRHFQVNPAKTQIVCSVPPGVGSGHVVEIDAHGHTVIEPLFSYQAPAIISVEQMGDGLVIKGANFGDINTPVCVTVDERVVGIAQMAKAHTKIVVLLTEELPAHRPLRVIVDNQKSAPYCLP